MLGLETGGTLGLYGQVGADTIVDGDGTETIDGLDMRGLYGETRKDDGAIFEIEGAEMIGLLTCLNWLTMLGYDSLGAMTDVDGALIFNILAGGDTAKAEAINVEGIAMLGAVVTGDTMKLCFNIAKGVTPT